MFGTVIAYILTIPVLAAMDLSWVGFLMKDFYQTRLGHLLSPTVNFYAAVGFYIIFSLGVFYFAAYQGHARHSYLYALCAGIFLGLVAYGTYDFTNMATLPGWPLSVTVIDILWGGVIAGATASAGFFFLSFLA